MLAELVHGSHGLAWAYGAVQVPMLAGLWRAQAAAHKYLLSPLVAATLTGLAAGAAAMGSAWLPPIAELAFATGLSVALGYAGGQALAKDAAPNKVHQRGSLVADTRSVASERSRGAHISIAGIEVPAQDEAKHFKLIGTTGTGKSTAIQEILTQALARGDRAVIADPDGGYLKRFFDRERGDRILNPFDASSAKWDLFAEVQTDYDVEQLARSLIPDHDGQDRSWRAYARTFFTAVTRQAREGQVRDVGELYRLLVSADAAELRTLVRGTAAQPFLDEANGRMFDSIRSVTSNAVSALQYVAQQKSAGLSVRDWVSSDSPGVLFMPYKANQIAALGSTISAWMRLAIFETMSGEERDPGSNAKPRRLWFVVDELDALGPIDGLKDALARLRKFDGRCLLGFQSVAQVSSTYGEGAAHTIVENCSNTLILRCAASEGGGTARFASQLIGEREVLRTTESKSRRVTELFGSVTRSQQLSVESSVLASQIEQLPDLSGFLKYASNPTWQRVQLNARQVWAQQRALAHQKPSPSSARGLADD
jgi:type IV secretory pathway TraG/TraD family ATPase VirD4